ncbi:hypothetical protein FGADI_8117 [Fusarium gaditjirri]|uniref:Uncharacterized protein n=1 Tax=Fusarium gaditjirri TaxID=282569 RepID=A0A8H4T3I5_9HYPO|nr:hypothetical protein FGADI_8117 [Fusarium gaditjirri]
MRSFKLRILVLHPLLDDSNDEIEILKSNNKVLQSLPGKFELPWICDMSNADAEAQLDAMITLRYIPNGDDPDLSKIIETFCDNLFCIDGKTSLESIRNGEEVLFKPLVGTENNAVDQIFLRSFIIGMGKSLTEDLTFKTPMTHGTNFLTRQPSRWFMGPMKSAVTLAECVQGLGDFLELIPPRTISSTEPHATAFIEHPITESLEIQDTAQKVGMVLSIMRGGCVVAKILDESGKDGQISPLNIDTAVTSLNSSIEQTGQLFKLADTETKAYEDKRDKWLLFTVLSVIAFAGGCLIPAAGPAITVARVVCIGGGTLSTAGCGYKTWEEWCNMNDSDKVRKTVRKLRQVLCSSWVYLSIALWRQNGVLYDEERLFEFAERIASEFGIRNLQTNWNNEAYATGFITNNRVIIAEDMRSIMEAVRKRRHISNENQPTGDDSTYQDSPDRNVQQGTMVDIRGQNLLETTIASGEGESTLVEPDSSSAIAETGDNTSKQHGHLSKSCIPEMSEPDLLGGFDGADSEFSGLYTPTELSYDRDD